MRYRIIIQKHEDNENYAAEMAKHEGDNRYRGNLRYDDSPQRMIVTDALIFDITPEQFNKIRLEALKAFE